MPVETIMTKQALAHTHCQPIAGSVFNLNFKNKYHLKVASGHRPHQLSYMYMRARNFTLIKD